MSDSKSMIRAGGLWKNKTKDGKMYLSGTMGGVRVLVFPNSYKKDGDKQPDYTLHFAENEKKDGPAKRDPNEEDAPF